MRIWRSRLDLLGRFVALDETELFAAVLHELGHAVGYASHTRRGYSVMRAAPGEVRLQARPALRGESLREPTLAALYALPSGSVLRRDPIPREAAATARVFADEANERLYHDHSADLTLDEGVDRFSADLEARGIRRRSADRNREP